MNSESGILFVVYGDERYFVEAKASIAQIKRIWPDIEIVMMTGEVEGPIMLNRIRGIRATPFDRTLLLDTDCWLVDPVPELFEVLDRFDLAVPLCDWRRTYQTDIPDCFFDLGGAPLAYRNSEVFQEFVDDWERRFLRDHELLGGRSHPCIPWFHALPSFTEALYHSDLRFTVLGQEYYWTGTGYVQQKVKIVHKRPAPAEEADKMNTVVGRPRTKLLYGEVQVWQA